MHPPLPWECLRSVLGWAGLCTASLTAQSTWRSPGLLWPGASQLVFDTGLGRPLAIAQLDIVHALVADAWPRQSSIGAPSGTSPGNLSSSFDPLRDRLVVMHADASLASRRTRVWEWDRTRWTEGASQGSPPLLDATAFASCFDPVRGTILVGAPSAVSSPMGTWRWNGSTWSQLASGGPSRRNSFAIAADTARNVIVLFGGNNSAGALDDTWLFDGTSWTRVFPNTVPTLGSLNVVHMASDTVAGGVVMMSGNLVWRWNGSDWQSLPSPPESATFSSTVRNRLAFDPALGRVIHLGIDTALHSFDGSAWQPIAAASAPILDAAGIEVAWDPHHNAVMTRNALGTWHWTGTRWRAMSSTHRPGPTAQACLATDLARSRTVFFGGRDPNTNTPSVDTWEWDGSDWTLLATAHSPPPRERAAMSYHAARGELVLFGGRALTGSFALLADTWVFDGVDWTQRFPLHAPSARIQHGMADDERRGVVVLFGGATQTDTWEWDGNDWRLARASAPSPSIGGRTLAWDLVRQEIVLVGASASHEPTTFVWNGIDWLSTPAPGLVGWDVSAPLATDRARGVLVFPRIDLFAPILEYAPELDAALVALGPGCAGSSGVPRLASPTGQTPVLGTAFPLEVSQLPMTAAAIGLLGSSSTSFGGTSLPYDLAPLGAPGCLLRVSIDVETGLAASGDPRAWNIALPGAPWLCGHRIHAQVVVLDTAANAAGLSLSNALTLVLGLR